MSKDGVYSPFNLRVEENNWTSGVRITDPDQFFAHAESVAMEPVYTEAVDELSEPYESTYTLYGWSGAGDPDPEEMYLYLPSHEWHASKLYHEYRDGSNFSKFWSELSEYTAPFEVFYYVRHGGEFPSVVEYVTGKYDAPLYKLISDSDGNVEMLRIDFEAIRTLESEF